MAERGLVADVPRGVPAPPAVLSSAYVVADADTGDVLAAKAPHVRLPPASTLKTLIALTLMPELDRRERYIATRADAAVEGSKAGIVPGGSYSVRELWQAVFLRSGNDARELPCEPERRPCPDGRADARQGRRARAARHDRRRPDRASTLPGSSRARTTSR
jgi:hypothetical protein